MVTRKNNIPAGYTALSRNGSILLLPDALFKALADDKEIETRIADEKEFSSAPVPFVRTEPEPAIPGELDCIRLNTDDDLADATALVKRTLKKAKFPLDGATADFSQNLFIALSMYLAYTELKNRTLVTVYDYICERGWDNEQQILYSITQKSHTVAFQQRTAARWFEVFLHNLSLISTETAAVLIKRCRHHWKAALTGKVFKKKTRPRCQTQIFNQDAIAKAFSTLASVKEDRRGGADGVLTNAKVNDGFRSIPDPVKAAAKLMEAKSRFENLIEPIDRLQTDLALCGAMKSSDFRITPVLLLGDPGIGKTFLAMQLAEALGVDMEKISAGGAQGGFQLSGSHNSWTGARPGAIFTLLAEGKSSSPVIVIDEIDKIRDAQYPVMPVLLDLFEPDTARTFKDEFLEVKFDASRIIYIMTANSLDGVPEPLLSRVEVFNVPRPEPEQRMRIIQHVMVHLCQKTGRQIELAVDACESLAERKDIDLRKTTRLVREAFTKAMLARKDVAMVTMPKHEGRGSIGFVR